MWPRRLHVSCIITHLKAVSLVKHNIHPFLHALKNYEQVFYFISCIGCDFFAFECQTIWTACKIRAMNMDFLSPPLTQQLRNSLFWGAKQYESDVITSRATALEIIKINAMSFAVADETFSRLHQGKILMKISYTYIKYICCSTFQNPHIVFPVNLIFL